MNWPLPEERPVLVLAEDESLVRWFAADFLDEAGFKVFEACCAEEAMTLIRSRPDVQVLVTGVEMRNEQDGFDLAQEVPTRLNRWRGNDAAFGRFDIG